MVWVDQRDRPWRHAGHHRCGFLWGIPGLIMAIPITVFMKIILEQFESTKLIASLLSGKETSIGEV